MKSISIVSFFFLSLSLAGCSAVEERLDCRDICTDYDACLGDLDVQDCIDACEDQNHRDIDDCDACLDSEGMGCVSCAAECADLAI
ncbi:MAG: hypothetical protein MUE69_26150 [Myxococcota bacterium]|nr:hypothetical protein [Myxococcota bacterium]